MAFVRSYQIIRLKDGHDFPNLRHPFQKELRSPAPKVQDAKDPDERGHPLSTALWLLHKGPAYQSTCLTSALAWYGQGHH
ncbi:hypothetical protein Gbfr_021_249 [Gluconobacter frateurii M-2]|nr:hypothetical protein Gbfr_021_249 [Gluconobacter frateurii M-2]